MTHQREIETLGMENPWLPAPPSQDQSGQFSAEDQNSPSAAFSQEETTHGQPLAEIVDQGSDLEASFHVNKEVVTPPLPKKASSRKKKVSESGKIKGATLHCFVSEETRKKLEELFQPGVPRCYSSISELVRTAVEREIDDQFTLAKGFRKVMEKHQRQTS